MEVDFYLTQEEEYQEEFLGDGDLEDKEDIAEEDLEMEHI